MISVDLFWSSISVDWFFRRFFPSLSRHFLNFSIFNFITNCYQFYFFCILQFLPIFTNFSIFTNFYQFFNLLQLSIFTNFYKFSNFQFLPIFTNFQCVAICNFYKILRKRSAPPPSLGAKRSTAFSRSESLHRLLSERIAPPPFIGAKRSTAFYRREALHSQLTQPSFWSRIGGDGGGGGGAAGGGGGGATTTSPRASPRASHDGCKCGSEALHDGFKCPWQMRRPNTHLRSK